MFTSTMNDAEIQQEARKDFFELSTQVRLYFERFTRRLNNMVGQSALMFNDIPTSLINSTVENKKWRTRKNNTWVGHFRYHNEIAGINITALCYLYTTIYRTHGTEYIFQSGRNTPMTERFTTHFIERYKERHLQPKKINIGNMPVPLYFQIHNQDSIMGRYYKTTDIDIQEGTHKKFWIAKEGIYVTDYIDGMLTYITFMDKEDLSPLKKQVYEEEIVWDLMLRICDKKRSEEERTRAAFSIAGNPDFGRIFERFSKRNVSIENDEKASYIKYIREEMAKLRITLDSVKKTNEQRQKDILRNNRLTGTLNTNTLIDDIEIKEYHLNGTKGSKPEY